MTTTTAPRKHGQAGAPDPIRLEWRVHQILLGGFPVIPPVVTSLGAAETTIGRDASCEIRLDSDKSVSKVHARLILGSDRLRVRDRSRHGTTVSRDEGDIPLSGTECELRDGDWITLGDSVLAIRHETSAPIAESDTVAVGSSSHWSNALRDLDELARLSTPIMILGDSGTGKEVAANFIHRKSRRAAGPFVAVNCGAITESLAESQLFGHVKGAFSNAVSDAKGFFGAANGGTLFLDEIGELPLPLQAKLLRVLDDGKIPVVGSPVPRQSDIRVVAATNRDVSADVESGRFREDLWFRFGNRVRLPPLRDRLEDLFLLADHFYREATRGRKDRGRFEINAELASAFRRRSSTGNTRAFRDLIVLMSASAPPYLLHKLEGRLREQLPAAAVTLEPLSIQRDRERIVELIDGGVSQTAMAARLGLPRRSMVRALTEADIAHPWSLHDGPEVVGDGTTF